MSAGDLEKKTNSLPNRTVRSSKHRLPYQNQNLQMLWTLFLFVLSLSIPQENGVVSSKSPCLMRYVIGLSAAERIRAS